MEAKLMSDFNFIKKSPASSQTGISTSKDGDFSRSQDATAPYRKRGNESNNITKTLYGEDLSIDSNTLELMIEKIHTLPDVRYELIDRVKRQLHEGNYETADKLELAIQALQDDFIE